MGYYAAGGAGTAALGWAYKKARKAVASMPYGEEFNQAWDWGTEKVMGYYRAGDVRPGLGGLSADAPRMPGSSASDYGYDPPSSGSSSSGGGYRRRGRTNPMNVRAARRAIRRLKGFERIAKTIYAFTHHKSAHGHFKLKGKRK